MKDWDLEGELEKAKLEAIKKRLNYPISSKPRPNRIKEFIKRHVVLVVLLSFSITTGASAYFNPDFRGWSKEAFSNAVSKVVTFFTPDLTPYEAEALASRGLSARSKGQFKESSEMFKQAMALYIKRGDTAGIAVAHVEMGILYTITKQYPLAKDHLEQAALYYGNEDDFNGRAYSSINLGKLYSAQNQFKLAVKNYKKAEGYYKESDNFEGLGNVSRALGNLSIVQNNYPNALRYFDEAESWYQKDNNDRGLVLTYNALSKLFSKQRDDKLARQFNDRSRSIELNGSSYDLPGFSIRKNFEWLISAFNQNRDVYESELNSKAKEETERALH